MLLPSPVTPLPPVPRSGMGGSFCFHTCASLPSLPTDSKPKPCTRDEMREGGNMSKASYHPSTPTIRVACAEGGGVIRRLLHTPPTYTPIQQSLPIWEKMARVYNFRK